MVVAVPHGSGGDPVYRNLPCYVAPPACRENDVLARFTGAAKDHDGIVVRVCADNPLIWPDGIRQLIRVIEESDGEVDYAAWRLPDGTPAIMRANGYFAEAFTASALRLADKFVVKSHPSREHVTPSMYEDGSGYRCAWLDTPDWFTGESAAIDTLEDLERVRSMVAEGRVPWTQ